MVTINNHSFNDLTWLHNVRPLVNYATTKEIPPALALIGDDGIGKKYLALNFAKSILCHSSNFLGCGVCDSCKQVDNNSNPDLLIVSDGATEIKVDTIRNISDFINKKAAKRYKLIIINEISNLNINAANALLKILEEPPANSSFIVTSSKVGVMPATVRSRLLLIPIATPNSEVAMNFLKQHEIENDVATAALAFANNAPLLALEFINNDKIKTWENWFNYLQQLTLGETTPISAAQGLAVTNAKEVLYFLQQWLQLTVKIKMGLELPPHFNKFINYQKVRLHMQHANIKELFKMVDAVNNKLGWELQGLQQNLELMLEDLLINWQRLCEGDYGNTATSTRGAVGNN